MATSRPIRRGEWLTHIQGHNIGMSYQAAGDENPVEYVRQEDFAIQDLFGQRCEQEVCVRIFGVAWPPSEDAYQAAITNGTAPGLYVREGDDTSNWGVYREVLARRVEEAIATRRGIGGVGVGETAPVTLRRFAPSPRIPNCDGKFISIDNGPGYTLDYDGHQMWANFGVRRELSPRVSLSTCEANVASGHYIELPLGSGAVRANTATARQDDEIRVGDVVEVVSCSDTRYTRRDDIGGGGRVTQRGVDSVQLTPVYDMRLPSGGVAAITDVCKVSSSSSQTVAAPMTDQEVARIEAAVTDEVRRSLSSTLVSSSDETTTRRVVNPVPPAVSVQLQPRGFTSEGITDYLRSLGATYIRVSRTPEGVPVVEVTGLSQQAFATARQNLPVGVQLRAVGGFLGQRDSGETTTSPTSSSAGITRGAQSEPPTLPPQSQQPTQQPSRFSLLEVDTDPSIDDASTSPPQALKAPVDLAALQAELRAEREAKRALAAAQTPPGRFDLLECDLPAVPAAVMPTKAPPQRPVVSSPPKPRPKTHNPVETITDLTAARSPLELARMLEGLNDELSTMKRQREAN